MIDYSIANITGYKSYLPTQTIRLPLKYPDGVEADTVNDQFINQISTNGEILDLSLHSSFIEAITIDVLNDLKTITLTPVAFQNNLNLDLQKLEIQLPHKLNTNKCFSVNITNTGDDLNLIIDFLDERYLFITIIVNLKDFIPNQGNTFELNNFRNWGNISVPYSFELRSKPFLFKSIDAHNFIISLNDGGMLHFKRSSYLQDFDVYNFNDQNKFSLSLFGIFKDSKSNCIVDLIIFNGGLITLTVDKVLQFWEIENHELKSSISLSNNNYLSPSINSYFKKFTLDGHEGLIFHTTNSFEAKSGNKFYILNHKSQLTNFQIDLPFESDNIWYIQDFHLTTNFQLAILWKSNISTVFITYNINSNYEIKSVSTSKLEVNEDFLNNYSQEYYMKEILNSNFNSLITKTTINILRERLNLPRLKVIDEISIKETIGRVEHENPWFLLNSIADEYKKSSQESLCFNIIKEEIIIVQTNGLGMIRPLSNFESYFQLSKILKTVEIQLSNKSLYKVYNYIVELPEINQQSMNYISDNFNFTLPENIDDINVELSNSIDKLESLINNKSHEDNFEINLSLFNKIYLITSFKDLMNIHKSILLRLLILLCNLDGDTSIKLVEQIWKKFQNFKVFDLVLNGNANILWNQPIIKGNVIEKYDYLNEVINNENYLINVILELVKLNQGVEVYEVLSNINTGPNKFLVGIIYLINKDERGFEMIEFTNFKSSNLDYLNYKFTNPNLTEFLSNVSKQDESGYYHNLSIFVAKEFKDNSFVNRAIDYESRAIKLTNDQKSKAQYYENLFKLSLISFNLPSIIDSLSNLTDQIVFPALVKILILKLMESKSIKQLFDYEFFNINYRIIDSILCECIESSNLIDSIKYFEILYSWRIHHFDKRKSIEALYSFVHNFEAANIDNLDLQTLKLVYLKILEFYIIILNGLKSFKNQDEKWLIANNKLITLNDLNKEYHTYLKKLNDLN